MDGVDFDAVLQCFPLVAAPLGGELPVAERDGTRYIAAADGLYREITTPWLRAVQPLVTTRDAVCPYGQVAACVAFRFSEVPTHLWAEFIEHARNVLPNEAAGRFLWNAATHAWRLAICHATDVSPERIDYLEPDLSEGECKVVDIHSHGYARAFFSAEDNLDDRGAIKIAVVIGNLGANPEVEARLISLDSTYPLQVGRDGGFVLAEVAPCCTA